MRIIVDKDIPFVQGVMEPFAQVSYLSPDQITAHTVRDADALFIRTRTKVDASLLAGSKVRFVATATIGFDHIDQDYCQQNAIHWVSCPGCNAQAVCDYVEEAIASLNAGKTDLTVGVVGYGHVGKLVAAMAASKGYKVFLSDPPLGIGMSLEELAPLCDVITFHTPLTHDGEYATYHLCNEDILRSCRTDALIINAARGGVVDEQALITRLSTPNCKLKTVIDCWENEPDIHTRLLQLVDLASFHIAGYSIEGKMNASQMCLSAFCEFFSLPILSINKKAVPLQGDSEKGWIQRITDALKSQPEAFEQLRKQYKLR